MKLFNNNRIEFGLYDFPVNEIIPEKISIQKPFKLFPDFPYTGNKLKRFHFAGICGREFTIGIAVVDIKFFSKCFYYIYDKKNNKLYKKDHFSLPSRNNYINLTPDNPESSFRNRKTSIYINDKRISLFSGDISLDIKFERASEPLRICTRTGYDGWTFTKKEVPHRIIDGTLNIEGKGYKISSPDYYLITDWTCGLMRRNTF